MKNITKKITIIEKLIILVGILILCGIIGFGYIVIHFIAKVW